MTGTISDPILLRESSGRVNHEFLGLFIIGSCGFHLDRIVAIAQLCEAEAAHVREVIYLVHKGTVTISMQGNQSTSKQVELDRELGCQRSIHIGKHLMSSQEVLGIVLEVVD